MSEKPKFIYVTYIASTPEKIFEALTDGTATAKYWFGNAATSDWKVGSPVEFHREGGLVLKGEVLENEPPRRLSYTFHPMHDPAMSTEVASRVVFELEKQHDQVRLTVTHDGFPPDSKVFGSISTGWPLVLSSLKSYLEANRVLWAPWYEKKKEAASA